MNCDEFKMTYQGYAPEHEPLREALCTLGNGYFASRGAAPESVADGTHYPGTYMAGLYNRLKSNVAGRLIENESMVNLPNWLPLTFRVEDERWFDLNNVEILSYSQELDMMQGILVRTVVFQDKKKRLTNLIQRRFVHMSLPHLAGLETIIQPQNWSGKIQIRSALDGRIENTLVERYRQLENRHLEQLENGIIQNHIIWLLVITNQSHIRIAQAARTRIFQDDQVYEVPDNVIKESGYIASQFDLKVNSGEPVRIEKIISLYNSKDLAISESLLECQQSLFHVPNFSQLLARHSISWSHLWEHWQICVETKNPRTEQTLNLHIFHLLQTVSPNTVDLDVGVPPRGLHGEAYRGLIMWDELFIFPLLNLRMPDITRELLMYRRRRLPKAILAAKAAGYPGAMFPWQSGSDGQEQAQTLHLNPQSGHWIPDNSELQQHINIAIAYNIWQYYQVSGDQDFISFYGAELIIQIARFWAGKAQYNQSRDRYEILKVMGPDEFHDRYPDAPEPGLNNNAYTNVMVAWIFWRTLEIIESLPEDRRQFIMEDLGIKEEELQLWEKIGHKIYVPFHNDLIISQFEGYGELEDFDWETYHEKYGDIHRLDRILEAEGDTPNRYKVSKQADLLMLFYLLSADELQILFKRLNYPFDHETIPENINYYLKRTSHGSTLSRIVHAWVVSRSHREYSWHLFQDALDSDIQDIQGGTTPEGIHLGAMAGTVDLILRCYSGLETRGDVLWFNPRLPSELNSLKFYVKYKRNWINVTITPTCINLRSRWGKMAPVKIGVDDKTFLLEPGATKVIDLD